jgi:outer membrane protein
MFKNLKLIFLVLLFLSNLSSARSEEKIVFVDIDYILVNSIAGKKINSQIEEKSKKLETEYKNNKKKIDDKKSNLIKQKNVLSESEFKKKYQELETDIKKYNNELANNNKKLAIYKNKAQNEFLIKLNQILQTYAKDNSISLMLNKQFILLGKNDLDLTKSLLSIFDKNVKKIDIK